MQKGLIVAELRALLNSYKRRGYIDIKYTVERLKDLIEWIEEENLNKDCICENDKSTYWNDKRFNRSTKLKAKELFQKQKSVELLIKPISKFEHCEINYLFKVYSEDFYYEYLVIEDKYNKYKINITDNNVEGSIKEKIYSWLFYNQTTYSTDDEGLDDYTTEYWEEQNWKGTQSPYRWEQDD